MGIRFYERTTSTVKKAYCQLCEQYITKDLMDSPARKHKKKYWASRSLELPKTFAIRDEVAIDIEPNFASEICKIFEMSGADFEKYFSMSEANS